MTSESETRMKYAGIVLQSFIALAVGILLPINGWALVTLVETTNRVSVLESQFQAFATAGPRYTEKDAERDYGVIMRLLEQQGKQIDDHEGRIRKLESN